MMIIVEGYVAYRGTMRITPRGSITTPFEITGDWLYKPDTKCWYGGGRSYPLSICTIVDRRCEGGDKNHA